MYWSVIHVVLLISTISVSCRNLNVLDEPPKGCEWQINTQYVNDKLEEIPVLYCQLRTISNVDYLLTNLTQTQADRVINLRLECSDVLFFESSLETTNRHGSFLSILRRLRDLSVEYCKIRNISSTALIPLRHLKKFTLKSHNSDWSVMTLDLHPDTFRGMSELRYLDLGDNNIWTIPKGLFCPLQLTLLNLTRNKIIEVDGIANCIDTVIVETLDLSFNAITTLNDNVFTQIRNLETLYLQNNVITLINDRALNGLSTLKTLNLSSNHLTTLPPELFVSSRELRHLYLQNNSLNVLAPGIFDELDQLQELDLSNNELQSTYRQFAGLPRLVVLNLKGNLLTKIDATQFGGLYSLQVLNLENNRLEFIGKNAFGMLKNLHALILSHNYLSQIDSNNFADMYALNQLYIDTNRIKTIHVDAFENMTNLQDLSLNGNLLSKVPECIVKLRNLRTLDLGKNRIEHLESTSFDGLDLLYGLRLVDNHIVNVTRDTFSTLPSLQVLNLASNRINYVEQSAFANNPSIKAIRLDSNKLTDISGVFTNLQTLVWLNVSSNFLKAFDYSYLPYSLEWLDMHENQITELANEYDLRNKLRIKMLDVSFNMITHVEERSIPESIEILFLNNNNIRLVQSGTFLGKHHLQKVVLYGNDLKYLDLSALSLDPVPAENDLPQFYVGGNPFYCDCKMEWLLRINKLSGTRNYPQVLDLDIVMCELEHSRGTPSLPLLELKPSQFLCQYETHCFAVCHCCDFDACDCEMTCPTNCTCYHDHTWSSNVVDCSNAGYTSVPERIPMDATEIYLDGNDLRELGSHVFIGKKKLEVLYLNNSNIIAMHNRTFNGVKSLKILHMENNKIDELRGYEFEQLEKLSELYLDHNRISYVGNKTFSNMQRLQILKLDQNNIVDFQPIVLNKESAGDSNGAGTKAVISLEGNKWSCDCNVLVNLETWLKDTGSDPTKLYCTNDKETLAEVIIRCDNKINAVSVIQREIFKNNVFYDYVAITTLCLVIVIVLFTVLFAYRQDVRVWIHSKYGIRFSNYDDNDDGDRLYDCYMIYSHKDDDLASRIIASELEQFGHSLCLHYRDLHLMGGASYLTDAMMGASDASRRILLIISSNFLCNEWSRAEFRAALQNVLNNRDKLVCIFNGEQIEPIDPELRVLLRDCTLTRWGERRFWEKLRYSLPDTTATQKRRGKRKDIGKIARYTPAPTAPNETSWYKYSDVPGVHQHNHHQHHTNHLHSHNHHNHNHHQLQNNAINNTDSTNFIENNSGITLTPTPTQSTYVSAGESSRSTEDEVSSASSQHYGGHSYVSVDGGNRPSSQFFSHHQCNKDATHHVYSTIPDNQTPRTYFV